MAIINTKADLKVCKIAAHQVLQIVIQYVESPTTNNGYFAAGAYTFCSGVKNPQPDNNGNSGCWCW
jgi:hypothetical protein